MIHTPPGTGVVTLYDIDDSDGIWRPRSVTTNTWMYTWGFLACKTLGQGDRDYRIAAAYIEFENVADPSDAVSVPSVTRQDDLDYYNGLSGSSTRDFLRVPLVTTPSIAVATGFEAYFGEGQGNELTIYVQTAGSTGVFGRVFSDTVNSKVAGIALVATPVVADRTLDVLFARTYYDASHQILKVPNGQIGVQYQLAFK